jgi:hypothetical protein
MPYQSTQAQWRASKQKLDKRLDKLDTIADQLARCIPKVGFPAQILSLITYLSLERQFAYSKVPADFYKWRQVSNPGGVHRYTL